MATKTIRAADSPHAWAWLGWICLELALIAGCSFFLAWFGRMRYPDFAAHPWFSSPSWQQVLGMAAVFGVGDLVLWWRHRMFPGFGTLFTLLAMSFGAALFQQFRTPRRKRR